MADERDNPRGVLIFGANGCGKTTLGREVARLLGWKHMDAEDYFFEPSDFAYAAPRTREEASRLMLADVQRHGSFVLSSVKGHYGDEITRLFRLAVYLFVPGELRMERVRRRSYERFGERIQPGGDLYEEEQRFFDMAANRSVESIEAWGEALVCPVLRMDGTADWRENAKIIQGIIVA